MDRRHHFRPKVWGTAIVGTKGQVVIPAKAREEFGIKEGDNLLVVSPPSRQAIGLIKSDELEKMLSKIQAKIEDTLNIINRK